METLIPLQIAGMQPIRFGAEKVLPSGEVPLDLTLEGVLPVVPESFSDFVKNLSGSQDHAVTEKPVFSEIASDLAGSEAVMDANAGMHQPPPLLQTDEMPISPGPFFKDTGMVPDDVVPQPDASYGDTQHSETTGLIDPERVVNETPAPAIVTGNPVVQVDPEQIVETKNRVVHVSPKSGSLSTDLVRVEIPTPHAPEGTGTHSSSRQVLIDPAGVNSGIPGFQGLEAAGSGVISEWVGPSVPEGVPMVSGTAQETGEPKPLIGGNDHANRQVEGQVLSAGRDLEISQRVAMTQPVIDNAKGSQTDIRGRVSLTLPEASEKTSPQGSLPPAGQDVSGNLSEGRDRGYSAPFHGNKPGMLDPRFEPVNTHVGNTNVSSVKPESSTPGAYQTSDPETLLQIEKMTPSLTGPQGTSVSEKSNVLETVRLPLETREIRTLTDIIEKVIWRQENGQSQARIQLKPAFLGHLHLNVIMDQLRVTVEIRAETLLARDFLETNLHVLKADLQDSGLEIDKINVLVDPDLNNQQEQGRTLAHKQMHRMNGQMKEENTHTDADPKEARQVISSGIEENQIDCFV